MSYADLKCAHPGCTNYVNMYIDYKDWCIEHAPLKSRKKVKEEEL